MTRATEGSLLSTVFVDYDNIYLSLKRKSEEAAKRFAKDAGLWIAEIASGRLITPTNGPALDMPRRIVMNRCYGNPVPRRNAHDNSTDMNSFPFVRHHYLRAGFEVIDCPPLTAQLKNSADIRMVMDVRDYLLHDTYFDEFIILSGDADFTPVLHRLRQHARRTVIYSNDYTAAPYTAISDGEVRESDLMAALLGQQVAGTVSDEASNRKGLPSPAVMAEARRSILADVLSHVRAESQPLLLEVLADRAVRTLGREQTVGTAWGGAGSFRDLLVADLPKGIEVTEHAPHYVFDTARQSTPRESLSDHGLAQAGPGAIERISKDFGDIRPEPLIPSEPRPTQQRQPAQQLREQPFAEPQSRPAAFADPAYPASAPRSPAADEAAHVAHRAMERSHPAIPSEQAPARRDAAAEPRFLERPAAQAATQSGSGRSPVPAQQQAAAAERVPQAEAPAPQRAPAPERSAVQTPDHASAIQKSIARIHEACQAPPISPPEYRVLFEVMAAEINDNGLTGTQTLVNICSRAKDLGVDLRKDDARFILEVVSEADPWFEQGSSPSLFASRFRNFVIARCKGQGLQLSATELDLIEAWFTGAAPRVAARKEEPAARSPQDSSHGLGHQEPQSSHDWFAEETPRAPQAHAGLQASSQQMLVDHSADQSDFGRYSETSDDFPRVLRNRTRA